MYLDYLKERYQDGLEIDWEEYIKRYNLTNHETEYGFITYTLQGDAVIVNDIYVKPEYRIKRVYAFLLHNHVMEEAEKAGKRVMIGFSEFQGKNHMAGIKAMKAAGFIPAFKTNDRFVFIKGI